MGKFFDTALNTVKSAIESQYGGNISLAARVWGVSVPTLYSWVKDGRRKPSLNKLSPLLDAIGATIALPQDNASIIRRLGPNAPRERIGGAEGLVSVPVMGATGAGEEIELFYSEPESWLLIPPRYAQEGVIGLYVEGDSMEPTIKKGAIVGIVPFSEDGLMEGGIYLVFRSPFGRMIKRIKYNSDGEIMLFSDNSIYSPFPLLNKKEEIKILGRVVWIWQEA